MHYSRNDSLYEIEKMMRGIPNFRKRRHGRMVLQTDMRDCIEEQPPPSSYAETLQITMSAVRYQPLEERLKEYMKEREMEQMNYRNEKHKEVFEEVVSNADRKNKVFISAVYLLTADFQLWQIEVSDSNPNELVAYVETWFDVDEKFGLNTRDDADTWVNMYARYDVENDTLKLECIISRDKEEKPCCYEPTQNEAVMLKEAIKDKIKEYYDCTPKEFCEMEKGMGMSQ